MAERQFSVVHSNTVDKGIIDKIDPWYIAEGAAAYLQNLDVSKPGARTRRRGATSIGGNTGAPSGMWESWDDVLFQNSMFSIHGGKVFSMNTSGSMLQRASGTTLTGLLHQAHEGRWASSNLPCVYVTQAQQDPSGATLASKILAIDIDNNYSQCASYAPQCARWWQHRLWIGGNVFAETSETFWWSAFDDGLSYSLTNSVQAEPGIGGQIVGFCPIRGSQPQLLIFKDRAICLFLPKWGSNATIPGAADALDTVNSDLRLLTSSVGCVGSRTIQETPGSKFGEVIWLAWDGFRSISVSSLDKVSVPSTPLSDPIQKTIQRINFTAARWASSAVVDNVYYCAVPLDGAIVNTHTICFDLVTGAWTVLTWAARDYAIGLCLETRDKLWMQYASQTTDTGATGAFTGYHNFLCYDEYLDPDGDNVQFQEDSRGFTPTNNIQDKQRWDRVGLTVKNEAGSSCALTVLYNIDERGWVTCGSLAFDAVAMQIYLGESPLPWEANVTAISTKYLSLADAPPGYEIQIRYVSEDTFALPSVIDLSIWSIPIGPEFDNEIS